jgi:16S rRNA (cytosine967-C5)-methyltransferase
MKADPVRARALEVLNRVDEGQNLDPLLHAALEALTEPQEKAFLAELVRGTLQWRGRYDHVIAAFVRKRPPSDPRLLNLLRLSLHQLLTLDGVPAYAAVHQGAELCRQMGSPRQVGFVNGLLQNIKRAVLDKPEDKEQSSAATETDRSDVVDGRTERMRRLFAGLESDPAAWMAAWHSHPLWLVRRWVKRYGAQMAAEICAGNNRPVAMAFHVLAPADPQAAAAFLAEAGCPVEQGNHARTLIARGRPSRALLTTILEQRSDLIVQDPTVQEATGWMFEPVEGTADRAGRCLDFCAAPGGKTARLAAALPDSWQITAMDNRRNRMELLTATLDRTGNQQVETVMSDGLRPPFPEGSFDAILLDGPCSGTGVMRHHPEGRWRLAPEIPARNGRLLKELTERCADLLAPGGLLMYATCSLEAEENEQVLDAVLSARTDLEPATAENWRRSWLPTESGSDGFFAARLKKTK